MMLAAARPKMALLTTKVRDHQSANLLRLQRVRRDAARCCSLQRGFAADFAGVWVVIVCSCNVISDHQVRAVTAEHAVRATSEVYRCLGCSACCGRCARTIRGIVDEARGRTRVDSAAAAIAAFARSEIESDIDDAEEPDDAPALKAAS